MRMWHAWNIQAGNFILLLWLWLLAFILSIGLLWCVSRMMSINRTQIAGSDLYTNSSTIHTMRPIRNKYTILLPIENGFSLCVCVFFRIVLATSLNAKNLRSRNRNKAFTIYLQLVLYILWTWHFNRISVCI